MDKVAELEKESKDLKELLDEISDHNKELARRVFDAESKLNPVGEPGYGGFGTPGFTGREMFRFRVGGDALLTDGPNTCVGTVTCADVQP
jgi:hypothetical protein